MNIIEFYLEKTKTDNPYLQQYRQKKKEIFDKLEEQKIANDAIIEIKKNIIEEIKNMWKK